MTMKMKQATVNEIATMIAISTVNTILSTVMTSATIKKKGKHFYFTTVIAKLEA